MAALVLACKQFWGRAQTCATAVKMANNNYYSLKFKFLKVFSFFFFLLYVEHDSHQKVHQKNHSILKALFFSKCPLVMIAMPIRSGLHLLHQKKAVISTRS